MSDNHCKLKRFIEYCVIYLFITSGTIAHRDRIKSCCRILLAVYIHITYYKNNRLQILSIPVLTIAATVILIHTHLDS
jgi:hypothetical protein